MTRDNYEERIAELKDRYEERINELQDRIYELTEKLELRPPHPRWKPERNKLYYTINIGYACAGSNTWDDDNVDGDNYSLGFVFKTEVEAEFAVERQRVLAEMREWGGKWNDGIALMYNRFDDSIETIMRTGLNTFGEMRFATPEDAHNCVEAVGAGRIKKYYFLIPEEETNE